MPEESGRGGASRKTRAVVDRVEDNGWAVVYLGDDEKDSFDLPAALLPEGASDGDHLHITVALDKDSRGDAEKRVRSLQERLSKHSGTEGKKDFKL